MTHPPLTDEHHHDLDLLLPFYATGALGEADRARVEEALKVSEDLRLHLALIKDEQAENIALHENLGHPSAKVLANLFAKIDAEPVSQLKAGKEKLARHVLDLGGWLADLFSPRTLGWASAAAALLLMVQAGMMSASLPSLTGKGYETASKQSPEAALLAGKYVLVTFTQEARLEEITALLRSMEASIAEGPRAGGIYRIQIGAAALAEAEVATKVQTLKQNTGLIKMVLPAR